MRNSYPGHNGQTRCVRIGRASGWNRHGEMRSFPRVCLGHADGPAHTRESPGTERVAAAPGPRGPRIVNHADEKRTGWKPRIIHETVEYGTNVIFLALVFVVFTWYRRLILAEYHITYLHYGIALIEALVLAKIIMIGDILGLGRKLADKPLILPTLYQSLVFSLWVVVFGVLEHTLVGLLHGEGLAGGVHKLTGQGGYELLARALIIFFAFIPFFAFREMERVLGEGTVRALFFRKRPSADSRPPGARTPSDRAPMKR
jgi:hypothetical protein